MRKRTLGVVLLAGLAISGGGAFTGSNIYSNGTANTIAGYGSSTATGATVQNIAYNTATDPSKLASVVFTVSTDVTGKVAKLTLRTAAGVVGSPYSCTLGTFSAYVAAVAGISPASGGQTITCAATDSPDITSFDSVGLTVTN